MCIRDSYVTAFLEHGILFFLDKGSSRSVIAFLWLVMALPRESLIPGKFDLKVNQSMKTPEYRGPTHWLLFCIRKTQKVTL